MSLSAMKRIGIEALACMVVKGYIKISFITKRDFQFFKLFTHPAMCGHKVPNRFIIVKKGTQT